MDPGGENESYEYVDEKEIDSRENEEKGVDDGDRLVGGKITNTRSSSKATRANPLRIKHLYEYPHVFISEEIIQQTPSSQHPAMNRNVRVAGWCSVS